MAETYSDTLHEWMLEQTPNPEKYSRRSWVQTIIDSNFEPHIKAEMIEFLDSTGVEFAPHPEAVEVGDHVFVGGGKIHWLVEGITEHDQYKHVRLRSPMSGRRKTEVIGPLTVQLTIHTKGDRA